MPEIFIKIALVIYGTLSLAVIILLWMNPSGESNVTNIASLLGAVGLVIIAAWPYLKSDEKHNFSSIILFRNNETHNLVSGKAKGVYQRNYTTMFSRANGHGELSQISYDISEADEIDFLARGVLEQFIMDFQTGWDEETTNLQPVYGTGNSSKISVASISPSKLVTLDELRRIFSSNKFITAENGIYGLGIRIPIDAEISSVYKNGIWAIIFENTDFKIVVTIAGIASSTLPSGVWGVFHSPALGNVYTQKQYTITTQAITKFGKRKVAFIDSYWKWYNNITNSLSIFDWKNVDQQIKDYFEREKLWETDKINFEQLKKHKY